MGIAVLATMSCSTLPLLDGSAVFARAFSSLEFARSWAAAPFIPAAAVVVVVVVAAAAVAIVVEVIFCLLLDAFVVVDRERGRKNEEAEEEEEEEEKTFLGSFLGAELVLDMAMLTMYRPTGYKEGVGLSLVTLSQVTMAICFEYLSCSGQGISLFMRCIFCSAIVT